MSASFSPSLPKSVTYVLNLLCYLCSEPAPEGARVFSTAKWLQDSAQEPVGTAKRLENLAQDGGLAEPWVFNVKR
jgi:hypothetical protein